MKLKLTIELVPKTAWYVNIRNKFSSEEWDVIRKKCYKQAMYRCEICNGTGQRWPVECHEIWRYDECSKEQELKGFIALCPACHMTKHVGLSQLNGNIEIVIKQLMNVNKMSREDAIGYIEKSFDVFTRRSKSSWTTNIDYARMYYKDDIGIT